MAEITAALVKELRERTGQGMMDCKKALTAASGDIEKAIDDMRSAGAIKAAKKAGNIAAEGAIAIKLDADNKRATIIEINSQTDFLALQDDFKQFVQSSLDQASSNPQFLDPSQVSDEAIAKEKEIFFALNEEKIKGKPPEILEKMVAGRIKKFLSESSLVEQAFVKDDTIKVGELAKKNGVKIVSFLRYEVGEGIDKGDVDFAAEVAAQLAASN
ncbi:UNVERIFIED_CONTAM: hypothetical protein GTU68_010910 [Idotea baltica]|nr:hypothetical protein [Idotea baltica]